MAMNKLNIFFLILLVTINCFSFWKRNPDITLSEETKEEYIKLSQEILEKLNIEFNFDILNIKVRELIAPFGNIKYLYDFEFSKDIDEYNNVRLTFNDNKTLFTLMVTPPRIFLKELENYKTVFQKAMKAREIIKLLLPDINQERIMLNEIYEKDKRFEFLIKYNGITAEQPINIKIDFESQTIVFVAISRHLLLTKNSNPEINIQITEEEAKITALKFILRNPEEWEKYTDLIMHWSDKKKLSLRNERYSGGIILVHPNGNSPSTREKYEKIHGISAFDGRTGPNGAALTELRPAWPVFLKKPSEYNLISREIGTIFQTYHNTPFCVIYIDAETGEVLGGM
ncbi:MAG: hypothetical protein WC337_09410 [Candidatus Muiribacteriota bacterium]